MGESVIVNVLLVIFSQKVVVKNFPFMQIFNEPLFFMCD
ncbi:hypothetical protein M917_1319 [Psychrobacter aquaticus CMS 56]|uniref:Uncharacterized protein n=1 Tax=Psychrobacter aquaticus CMS 56 TaxID=1354303 RepID=U4T3I0_9GAMM|nr:hypothetical protein M917_1319 [Psychrobacter aquaticus CMS 56]